MDERIDRRRFEAKRTRKPILAARRMAEFACEEHSGPVLDP